MTTIATDGKVVAADTRQVGQYIDQIESVKLYVIRGEIIGIAGDCAEAYNYLDWLKCGAKPSQKPNFDKDSEFEALHVTKDGVFHVTKSIHKVLVGTPSAIGSGGDYAMAAMMAGATPQKAVSISMKLDPYTGGRVVTKRLGKAK